MGASSSLFRAEPFGRARENDQAEMQEVQGRTGKDEKRIGRMGISDRTNPVNKTNTLIAARPELLEPQDQEIGANFMKLRNAVATGWSLLIYFFVGCRRNVTLSVIFAITTSESCCQSAQPMEKE